MLDDVLGQTELGDAVHQHAACNVQGFVYGNLIAQLGQVAGNGQAGRTCTDNCHLMAVRLRLSSRGVDVFTVPVSHKALQAANADGFALDAAHALALALVLLRADAAADGGQGRGLVNDLIGALIVLFGDLLDEFGDLDLHRAAGDAGMVLAV